MDNIIDEIRRVFSKASVVVSNDGISAVYTAKPGVIVQEVHNDDIGFLASVISSCGKFRMKSVSGKNFSVWFDAGIDVDTTTFFQPIDGNITLNGLISSLEESGSKISGDFIEFAFKSKMRWNIGVDEFIESVMKKTGEIRTEDQEISDMERWVKLKGYMDGLSSEVDLNELESTEPDEYGCGYITFSVTPESGPLLLTDHGLSMFIDVLMHSSNFSMEIDVESGEAEITLFA